MSDKDIFSIIDYGSSNLRLGIFENYPPFNKFLINKPVLKVAEKFTKRLSQFLNEEPLQFRAYLL